jgi:RND family efflux transporter MFP subunit
MKIGAHKPLSNQSGLRGATVLLAAGALAAGIALGAVIFGGGETNERRSAQSAANDPQAARAGQASRASGQRSPGGRGGQGGFGGFGAPPAVTMIPVSYASVTDSLTAVGTGRANQSLTLNAETAGVISRITIKPGEEVAAGAALLQLDDEQQRIAVDKARADFAIAKTNRDRFTGLRDLESASQQEYETAQNAFAAARASLEQADYNLSRRTVRAPFAGVLGLTALDVGDYLTVGAPITTIDDVSSLLVDFVVPESVAAQMKVGLELQAALQSADGRNVPARVRAVDSRIDPATRTRRIEAVLDNQDRSLLPGSTFAIALQLPGRQALSVPGLAIQYDRAGAYVWKRGADGGAERTPVTIVRRSADAVLIDAPLTATDEIVAEGGDQVRAGVPLPAKDGARSGGAAGPSAANG